MNILEKIVLRKKERIAEARKQKPFASVKENALLIAEKKIGGVFENALRGGKMSFICEIKKASPSKGLISEKFDYLNIAKEYEKAGASAISVLTEEDFFLGKGEYLQNVSEAVDIPTLRKDFIIDEYQIYESVNLGAAAILLIVSILKKEELRKFIKLASELKLDVLVEAHDESEIKIATHEGAKIIGVNNRNLKDFTIDLNNSIALRKLISEKIIFVSESGIEKREDIKRLEENNINAVLIGESMMRSKNKAEFLGKLKGSI